MRSRLFLLIIVTMFSQAGQAVQLGKIQVNSTQERAFNAQIVVGIEKGDNLEQVKYSIASPEIYKSQGMQRQAIHSDISIDLLESQGKVPTLILKSKKPVKDSFLDLLIQIDSPKGRLFKEYTVLLDPPTKKEADRPADEVTIKNTANNTKPKVSKKVKATSIVTKPGKTLFQIARENNISGITTAQYAVAVFQINPAAFANNNINGLNKGQKISLPTKDYFQKLSHLEARKILKEQNIQWKKITNKNLRKVSEKKPTAPNKKNNLELSKLKAEVQRLRKELKEVNESTDLVSKANSVDEVAIKSEEKITQVDKVPEIENIQPAEEEVSEAIDNQDFVSSIAVQEEDIIEEVIMDETSLPEDNSRSGLVYVLMILFAILGGLLVFLTKKKASLRTLPKDPIRTSVDEYIYKKNIRKNMTNKY